MTDAGLMTVVTPSYNQATYLETTISSVLRQEGAGLEYIIIDGGSTDGSAEIVRRYADQLALCVIEPDRGQAQAINKGFRAARGEILAWLNADDCYYPNTLAAVAEFFLRHPDVDVVYGDVNFIDAAGRQLGTMPAWEFDPQLQLCATNLVLQPATFIRRRVYEKIGGLDEHLHYALDYDYWCRAVIAGACFQHVPQVWATYRLHPTSKTQAQANQFAAEMRQVVDRSFASGKLPVAWRRLADSNWEQFQAETALRQQRRKDARTHFLAAAQHHPWRLKTIALLAFALSPRLGLWIRRLRWRFAGRREQPWHLFTP
jgi:glycosyltransferase involved in cell wall biosynthesis